MNVCFETFGCRLNRAEALEMEALYRANGWTVTKRHDEADLIVVRGCSVTARAQRDCEHLIHHLQRKYPMAHLRIEGCLKMSSPPLPRLFKPERPTLQAATDVPTRTARAYLKVQDGCNAKCAFCIVPQFRGKATSVSCADACARARQFIAAGYREIVVTGCNLTQYADGGRRLPELLDALASLDSAVRIRIGSLEPGSLARETVEVVAAHANVCRFLHLSIQSGSDNILQVMQRPYRVKDIESLLERVQDCLPTVGLGCDLMTGFPGENNNDFLRTQQLLEKYPFSNAHVFPYSERPGTPAAKMTGVVARDIRSIRAHKLVDLATKKRETFAQQFLGRTVDVVVEDEGKAAGWTGEYLWCSLNKAAAERLGRSDEIQRRACLRALVTEAHEGQLKGRLL